MMPTTKKWTFTRAIGVVCGAIIDRIVRWLALSRIHPNVLTFLGLLINIWAAWLFAQGSFRWAAVVVIGAGLFDMVDGRVARATSQVTRFGVVDQDDVDQGQDLLERVKLVVNPVVHCVADHNLWPVHLRQDVALQVRINVAEEQIFQGPMFGSYLWGEIGKHIELSIESASHVQI